MDKPMAAECGYDVFISYRRSNGRDVARILQQGLERKGLKVFFDLQEITDGKFNEKLYESIGQSKNLIVLLTDGALDRCAIEGDWVREELEFAFANNINVVPVLPSGHALCFPASLPASLGALRDIQVSNLDQNSLFRESVDKIIQERLRGVISIDDQVRKEAELAFLSRARRFKADDGKIDADEMLQLNEMASRLHIDVVRRELLIEQVEREYEEARRASGPLARQPAENGPCEGLTDVVSGDEHFHLLAPSEISRSDLDGTIELDKFVYPDELIPDSDSVWSWFSSNPDIDFIIKETVSGKVIAYAEAMPVSDESYAGIKSGQAVDLKFMTAENIMSYEMPGVYNIYISSIVIHPKYRNTVVFRMLFDALVRRCMSLVENEVFVGKLLADVVTPECTKFCKLFGMKNLGGTEHGTTLFEAVMMPPEFRTTSRLTKQLKDIYRSKYDEMPYAFE